LIQPRKLEFPFAGIIARALREAGRLKEPNASP
jgi:hypothetical protein